MNSDNNDNISHLTQQTIEVLTPTFIANKILTTPVTLRLRPKTDRSILNLAQVHRNLDTVQKLIEPTLKNHYNSETKRCIGTIFLRRN